MRKLVVITAKLVGAAAAGYAAAAILFTLMAASWILLNKNSRHVIIRK